MIIHSIQGHWTLCKGHVEGSELEHETAEREIREETGLSVEFIDGFREQISYSPSPDCTKNVAFFLAEITGGIPTCQPEEVSEISFLPFPEAENLLTHDSDRSVLEKAERFLTTR